MILDEDFCFFVEIVNFVNVGWFLNVVGVFYDWMVLEFFVDDVLCVLLIVMVMVIDLGIFEDCLFKIVFGVWVIECKFCVGVFVVFCVVKSVSCGV